MVYGKKQSKLKSKEELLNEIEKMKKYYNEETINYLVSLVELNTTVFKDKQFCELFSGIDLFDNIIKYNICNRSIKIINDINDIDNEKVIFSFMNDCFTIWYIDDCLGEIKIMEASFARELFSFRSRSEVVPYIYLYKHINIEYNYEVEKVSEVNNVINDVLLSDWNINFNYDKIRKFSWIDVSVKELYNINKSMKVRKIVRSISE